LAGHTKMAQTGFTPISNYYSATATNVPTAGNLVAGELAINTADGKLFYKDSSGVVQTIATKATAGLPTTTTGSGSIVLATSPTVTNPALGGATSGSVTLAVPAVAGSNTATFPAATGTIMVSGNMPAFSASLSANQTVNSGATTKIAFNTEQFDTNSCYDNATNYRFTPTVAGYYQINVTLDFSDVSVGVQDVLGRLYKNGSQYLAPIRMQTGAGREVGITIAQLVSMNGSTDYLEVYFQVVAATNCLVYASSNFCGTLVRNS